MERLSALLLIVALVAMIWAQVRKNRRVVSPTSVQAEAKPLPIVFSKYALAVDGPTEVETGVEYSYAVTVTGDGSGNAVRQGSVIYQVIDTSEALIESNVVLSKSFATDASESTTVPITIS